MPDPTQRVDVKPPQEVVDPPEALTPPSPGPMGLRRFEGRVPLVVLVLVLLGVSGLVGAACGDDGVDRAEIERQLEELLVAAPYGVDDPAIECPADIEFEVGAEFECQATATDGSSAMIEVGVESTDGDGEFSIGNLVHVAEIADECRAEVAELLEGAGVDDACTAIDCPGLVEAMPGGTLSCGFALESGQSGTIEIPLDDRGVSHEGGWEATVE